MKQTNIIQADAPVLRTKAAPIPLAMIDSNETHEAIVAMSEALAHESDGVAIAAPQIGISKQIFLVSGRHFPVPDTSQYNDWVFINPTITNHSKTTHQCEEGCLSVRWKYGTVSRYERVTVTAYDEFGNQFSRGASGLLAQIFQHEIDHLHGILFIDHARNIEHLPPQQ